MHNCVLFLADTLLLYRDTDDGTGLPGEALVRAQELFAAIAPLLELQRSGCVPTALRRSLSQRLCVLLLFGGAWEVKSCGPFAVPAGMRWALTWLLMEAFTQPAADRMAEEEEVESAAARGRLLCFFGCLGKMSGRHLLAVAVASEGFLSLELRGAAVPLPRLARFLSNQLARPGGSSLEEVSEEAAGLWLECLWRPLALLCLEGSVAASEPELPQALVSCLTSTAPPNSSLEAVAEFRFVPAALRPMYVSEVAWVLNRMVELFSWTRSRAPGQGLPAQLLELHRRTASRASGDIQWAKVYHKADERRRVLRGLVAKLGVDTRMAPAAPPEERPARRKAPGRPAQARGAAVGMKRGGQQCAGGPRQMLHPAACSGPPRPAPSRQQVFRQARPSASGTQQHLFQQRPPDLPAGHGYGGDSCTPGGPSDFFLLHGEFIEAP